MDKTPKAGEPLRFEGHEYVLTEFDEKRGLFRFARPEGVEAPKRLGVGNIADLRWAKDLNAWYLPWRVAPRLSSVLAAMQENGTAAVTVDTVRRAVHSHVAFTEHGRDDVALAAALKAHLEG